MVPLVYIGGAAAVGGGLLLGKFVANRWGLLRARFSGAASRYALSSYEPVTSLPTDWQRWGGARPEPGGAPFGTILALPGIEKMTPEFRATLLDVAQQLNMPVDSLALIMYSESGFDSAAPRSATGTPRGGLIQLTVGAGLPGFSSASDVWAVRDMSAVDQLQRVVLPFYQRVASKVSGADPGYLYMLNFLPAVAGSPDSRVIGVADGHTGPGGESSSTPLISGGSLTLGKIYAANHGFDRGQKGYFTIGDVTEHLVTKAGAANGWRIAVDGTMLDPTKTAGGCGNYGKRAGGSGAHQSDTILVLYFSQSGPRVCVLGQGGTLTDWSEWPIEGGYARNPDGSTVCLNDVCGMLLGHAYALYGDLGIGPDLGLVATGADGHAMLLPKAAKTAAGCGSSLPPLVYHPAFYRTAGSYGSSNVPGPFVTPYSSASQRPGASPAMRHDASEALGDAFNDPYNPFNEWESLNHPSSPQPQLLEEVQVEPDVKQANGAGIAPRRRRAAGPGTGSTVTPEQVAIVQRGILPAFQAGQTDPVNWTQIPVGEYQIMVTNEPLSVSGLRLPTDMEEEIIIANGLKALPITPAVSDARWRYAVRGLPFGKAGSGLADKRGAIINDPGQVIAWNQAYPNTGEFSDGFWKEGVIVPGLTEHGNGALAQYGGRMNDTETSPTVQQGKPGAHFEKYKDYSNTPTYMGRMALKNGQVVDLLDDLAAGCSLGGPLPVWLVNKFRGTVGV